MASFVSPIEIKKQSEYVEKIKLLVGDKGLKAFVYTLGCQQNEADSEKIMGTLQKMGYQITENEKEADILMVNTCAIRDHAEKRALSIIGRFKHYKAENPDIIIGVCGCMSAQEHQREKLKHSYHYVDFTFGTGALHRLPEFVYNALNKKKRYFDIDLATPEIAEGIEALRQSPYRAWVSIMYGCNNFCTYCIVPYVRGRERSRKMEDILSEIKDLVSKGYKDITLLGQNVNSYGKDLEEKTNIAKLLSEISKIDGDFWIHLMTSHPKDASAEMIEAIKSSPRTSGHFHLPLQSGSDEILTKMNRHYNLERYLSIIEKLRENNENITLTTDLIVGFPGESEDDFNKTLEVIKKVKYDSVFSFIYSKRKGTPAASMENQVPSEEQHRRYDILCNIQNDISKQINESYIGTCQKVLVDGKSKNNEGVYTSRTQGNKIVHFECENDYTGTFKTVKITRADTFALYGEII
ncbi:MAG: tRNA (N6-isopentenyl adenosine(37)-C2)-methylthiotransferase MiaB [Clostridia bacterium]|nr:tRNA (N6-isopentenyl adenosine(37)-C2)-methylthiotransferase MiaB [Clostridia bacterium]